MSDRVAKAYDPNKLAKAALLFKGAKAKEAQAREAMDEVMLMIVQHGVSVGQLAERVGVSPDALSQQVKRYRIANGLPRPNGGGSEKWQNRPPRATRTKLGVRKSV